jgi:hypothetical protein
MDGKPWLAMLKNNLFDLLWSFHYPQVNPAAVQTSAVKQSTAAKTSRCEAMNSCQLIVRPHSGAGAMSCRFKKLAPVWWLTSCPRGLSLLSSMVPQSGDLVRDLGFPAADGDVFYFWDNQVGLQIYYHTLGGWYPQPPSLAVGQSFWVRKVAATNWTRTFIVQ